MSLVSRVIIGHQSGISLAFKTKNPNRKCISNSGIHLPQFGVRNRHLQLEAKKRRINPSDARKLDSQTMPSDDSQTTKPLSPRHSPAHTPVLLEEVISCLEPKTGGVYVDATFGMGGHSRSILKYDGTTVLGIDRDASVLKKALATSRSLREAALKDEHLKLYHGRFSQMSILLKDYIGTVDGILMDIGVSSVQLDSAERGFSYRQELDAKLDMRMDQSSPGPTAHDIVNHWSEQKLADLIWTFGEDRRARQIAKAIIERRQKSNKPIETTFELAQLISNAIPRGTSEYMSPQERIAEHAKRTFQALRIEVNQELEELKLGLRATESLLRPGGKLVVISFHSLEDRIVKEYFNHASGKPVESKLHPSLQEALKTKVSMPSANTRLNSHTALPTYDSVRNKITKASSGELANNKRARPAKLRVATRTAAPSQWPSQLL
jgi:16S rRNA (cytosine1402-N4)-methyltransferase